MVVTDGARPVGYFHASRDGGSVDEIGWDSGNAPENARVFQAACSRAAAQGSAEVSFWIDDADGAADEAFREGFGNVPRTYCGPDGQPTESSDPSAHRLENASEGFGYMVRFLNPGPGVLAKVADTDALTDVMARHSWVFFDGDMM